MTKVLIYNDYVHNNQMVLNRVADITGLRSVSFCDADDIKDGILDDDISLLIMPGGADLFYCERLDGAANILIKNYVESGGSYLGICAGAYYGATALEWAKGDGEFAICDTRELAFTDATAIGPIYSYIQEHDFSKSWDGLCQLSYNGQSFKAMYRGGCYFENAKDADVIARYDDLTDKPAAIIGKDFGRGRVVLSGPHIELRSFDYGKLLYKNQNMHYDYCKKVRDALKPHDQNLNDMWERIIKGLIS